MSTFEPFQKKKQQDLVNPWSIDFKTDGGKSTCRADNIRLSNVEVHRGTSNLNIKPMTMSPLWIS